MRVFVFSFEVTYRYWLHPTSRKSDVWECWMNPIPLLAVWMRAQVKVESSGLDKAAICSNWLSITVLHTIIVYSVFGYFSSHSNRLWRSAARPRRSTRHLFIISLFLTSIPTHLLLKQDIIHVHRLTLESSEQHSENMSIGSSHDHVEVPPTIARAASWPVEFIISPWWSTVECITRTRESNEHSYPSFSPGSYASQQAPMSPLGQLNEVPVDTADDIIVIKGRSFISKDSTEMMVSSRRGILRHVPSWWKHDRSWLTSLAVRAPETGAFRSFRIFILEQCGFETESSSLLMLNSEHEVMWLHKLNMTVECEAVLTDGTHNLIHRCNKRSIHGMAFLVIKFLHSTSQ